MSAESWRCQIRGRYEQYAVLSFILPEDSSDLFSAFLEFNVFVIMEAILRPLQ